MKISFDRDIVLILFHDALITVGAMYGVLSKNRIFEPDMKDTRDYVYY